MITIKFILFILNKIIFNLQYYINGPDRQVHHSVTLHCCSNYGYKIVMIVFGYLSIFLWNSYFPMVIPIEINRRLCSTASDIRFAALAEAASKVIGPFTIDNAASIP